MALDNCKIKQIASTARCFRSYAFVIERIVRKCYCPGSRQKASDMILLEIVKGGFAK